MRLISIAVKNGIDNSLSTARAVAHVVHEVSAVDSFEYIFVVVVVVAAAVAHVVHEVSAVDSFEYIFVVVVAAAVYVNGHGVVISGQGVEAGVSRSISHAILRSSNTLSCWK